MYIECPHCNAIFALPEGMDYTDHEKKMRCGECATVFNVSNHLTTGNNQAIDDSHFNFDQLFEGEKLDDDASFDSTAQYTSNTHDSLDDTIELHAEQIEAVEIDKLEADSAFTELHVETEKNTESKTDNESGYTSEDAPGTDNLDTAQVDVFEEYVRKNQISQNEPYSGITNKASGEVLDDDQNLLPEIDHNLYTPNVIEDEVDESVDDLYDLMTPSDNKLEKTIEDMGLPLLDIVDNGKESDELGKLGRPPDNWSELPTLDNLQLIKEEDLRQGSAFLHQSQSNVSVNDSAHESSKRTGDDNDIPIFDTDPDEKQSQSSLALEIQEDLLNGDFLSESDSGFPQQPVDSEGYPLDMESTESSEVALDNNNFTPADTLISLRRDDFLSAERTLHTADFDRKKAALYGSATLGLLLLLSLQYIYNNREELSISSFTKPLVAAVCKVTGCSINRKRYPHLIETIDKTIQKQGNTRNILVIKSTIRNTANRPQPYPIVEIRFTDINERTLAFRRFGPVEYLQNASLAPPLMLPGEPVYLDLIVADPGREATSYSFNYL